MMELLEKKNRTKQNGDSLDPGIIARLPSGMLEMEKILRDWIVQPFHFRDKENNPRKGKFCTFANTQKCKCSSQLTIKLFSCL